MGRQDWWSVCLCSIHQRKVRWIWWTEARRASQFGRVRWIFPQYERKPPGENPSNRDAIESIQCLHIPADQVVTNAHYGYVYCMAMHTTTTTIGNDVKDILVSGSGDECVKVNCDYFWRSNLNHAQLWNCSFECIRAIGTLESSDGAILSLVTRDGTIYAGCQGGKIKVGSFENKENMAWRFSWIGLGHCYFHFSTKYYCSWGHN